MSGMVGWFWSDEKLRGMLSKKTSSLVCLIFWAIHTAVQYQSTSVQVRPSAKWLEGVLAFHHCVHEIEPGSGRGNLLAAIEDSWPALRSCHPWSLRWLG